MERVDLCTAALPPGFRFHPTDEELVIHYLKKKISAAPLPAAIIADIDLYKFDPWELPGCRTCRTPRLRRNSPARKFSNISSLESLILQQNHLPLPPELGNCSSLVIFTAAENLLNGSIPSELGQAIFGEQVWYFFSPRERKYPNGARPNRAATSGYWKATGTDKPIMTDGGTQRVGVKKALVFYKGRPPKGLKTNWIMHEFRLIDNKPGPIPDFANKKGSSRLDEWVLCRIYEKRNAPRPEHEYRDEPTSSMMISDGGEGLFPALLDDSPVANRSFSSFYDDVDRRMLPGRNVFSVFGQPVTAEENIIGDGIFEQQPYHQHGTMNWWLS